VLTATQHDAQSLQLLQTITSDSSIKHTSHSIIYQQLTSNYTMSCAIVHI